MRTLVWSAAFVRVFKRAVRRQPELRARVERTLQQLAYDNRILFEFVQNPESGEEEILLLTMGTHEEVY